MTTKIIGTGSYLPEYVVTKDLAYHHLQWTTMTLRNWLIPVMSGSLPGRGFEIDELLPTKVE